MNKVRIAFFFLVALASLAAFVSTGSYVFADGSEPMPFCRPNQTTNCKPPGQ